MSRPKPYSKASKGKGKVVIDFTSIQSALNTSNHDLESWLQEGVQQEEQGERYQFGAKATRHYTNAVICYKCALTKNSKSFDAIYNSARTTFELGTTHLSSPDCFIAIEESIKGFKLALSILEESSSLNSNYSEFKIDSLFNLAQALVVLQDMLDDGVTFDKKIGSTKYAEEAKKLFVEVERLQRIEMEKVFSIEGQMGAEDMNDEGEEDAEMEDIGSSSNDDQSGAAVQGSIITPTQIIETLIEAIENDINLYTLTTTIDTTSLIVDISASLDRVTVLRNRIPSTQNTSALDLQLSILSLSFSSTCVSNILPTSPYYLTSKATISQYQTLITSIPSHPDLLSSYADYLVTQISSTTTSDSNLQTTSIQFATLALQIYEQVFSILNDRFSPHRSNTPQHSIPTLLASNLIERGKLNRILSLFPSTVSTTTTTNQINYKIKSKKCFIEALEISGIGWKLQDFNQLLLPTTKIGSGIPRLDWNTILVAREAWFQLVRIVISEGGSDAGGGDPIHSWERISGRKGKEDVRWFLKDIEGDLISELSEGNEQVVWNSLL